MTSVGSVADTIASDYGVRLAVVGLFTAVLVLTHLLAQLPAGRATDRFGSVPVGLVAAGLCVAGNALGLLGPDVGLALPARAIVGLGSGAGFVAGADAMRASGLSATWQGVFGAATMAGGGLAVAVTPQLVGGLGWRAPYWSGLAIAAAVGLAVLVALPVRRPRPAHRVAFVVDRRLVPLGMIHAASLGLSFVAAAWVVPLLERQGHDRRSAAVVGALVLLGGIVTRPLGGVLVHRAPDRARAALAAGLVAGAVAGGILSLRLPLPLLAIGTLLAGVSAGIPFAILFAAAQRLRPDAPGGAVGFVNAWAVLVLLVGTPLAGLAFALPGDGRLGFAGIGIASAATLLVLRRAPVAEADLSGERDAGDG
jgi:MFS family permease